MNIKSIQLYTGLALSLLTFCASGEKQFISETKNELCDLVPTVIFSADEMVNTADSMGDTSITKQAIERLIEKSPPTKPMDFWIYDTFDEAIDRLLDGESAEQIAIDMSARCFSDPLILKSRVASITDGDTFKAQGRSDTVPFRLYGIDAPERNQPGGLESRIALISMVGSKVVSIEVIDVDRYERLIGKVTIDGNDVSLELLKKGHAWHYKKYDSNPEYAEAENAARAAKIGLWKDGEAIEPWIFRTGH